MNEEQFIRPEAAGCHLSTSPPSNSRGWTSGLASCIVPSFWPSWSTQAGGSDAHAEQYRQDLATASGEDLSDVEELGFLRFDALDNEKRPVVVVVGRAIPCALMDRERLYRYIILKLDRVASAGPFSVLYVHTAAAAKDNSPGSWWLLQKLKQLPQVYHENLTKFRVLHTDLQMWTVMWALCPWFAAEFWSKVEFVPRVEFLDEQMSAAKLHLPEFVLRHDGELEDQPLMDYGIVVNKEAIPPGMVLPA